MSVVTSGMVVTTGCLSAQDPPSVRRVQLRNYDTVPHTVDVIGRNTVDDSIVFWATKELEAKDENVLGTATIDEEIPTGAQVRQLGVRTGGDQWLTRTVSEITQATCVNLTVRIDESATTNIIPSNIEC
jgi:hypothetical protein